MPARILIADDDPSALNLMKLALRAEGFDVIAVDDNTAALRIAQAEGPDLIILDIMMPGLDGIEACRQLRSRTETANIPVIFLTAKTQVEDRILGLQVGADDYITKPADPREIVARAQAVLARIKRRPPTKQGRVVSVLGAKGGVGTSTIVVNLGAALAAEMPTLVIDLHLHAATVAWQLRQPQRPSLAMLLAMEAGRIDKLQVEKRLVQHSSGLRALTSTAATDGPRELPAPGTLAIVHTARLLADVVLVDMSHILCQASHDVLGDSEMVILVLGAQPMDVACAEQVASLLPSNGTGDSTHGLVIVNRVASPLNLPVSEIEQRLRGKCLGMMPPANEEIAASYFQGRPLVTWQSQSLAVSALRELAQRLKAELLHLQWPML